MVNFFIGRPIFATVLALLMLLVGGICIFVLPISLYPDIVPPQVQVTTTYTGADAQTVADTVTTPIEQQINGVKGHDLLQLGQHDQRPRPTSSPRSTSATTRTSPPSTSRTRSQTAQAEPAARGQAVRRDDQEDLDQHGLRRQPGLARRPVRRDLPRQLRPDQRRRRPEADPGRQRRQRRSAASTPCGSGSTRTGWPTSGSRPPRSSRRSSRRTSRPPRARSAPCRRRPGQRFEYPVTSKGRLSKVEEFEKIVVRRNDDGSIVCLSRRRPRRARLGELRDGRLAQRQARRHDPDLPALRRQRPGHRQAGPQRDGPAGQELPAGPGVPDRLRHDPVRPARTSPRSRTRSSRRSCWC